MPREKSRDDMHSCSCYGFSLEKLAVYFCWLKLKAVGLDVQIFYVQLEYIFPVDVNF